MRLVDLSQPLNQDAPFWPYYPPFEVKYIKRKAEHGVNAQYILMAAKRVLDRKAGKRVKTIPEYITTAQEQLTIERAASIEEALKRAPKKWN